MIEERTVRVAVLTFREAWSKAAMRKTWEESLMYRRSANPCQPPNIRTVETEVAPRAT